MSSPGRTLSRPSPYWRLNCSRVLGIYSKGSSHRSEKGVRHVQPGKPIETIYPDSRHCVLQMGCGSFQKQIGYSKVAIVSIRWETLSLCHVQMKRTHTSLGDLWPLWDKVLIWIKNWQYQHRTASPQMTIQCCVSNIVAASNHFISRDRRSAPIRFTIDLIVYLHQ